MNQRGKGWKSTRYHCAFQEMIHCASHHSTSGLPVAQRRSEGQDSWPASFTKWEATTGKPATEQLTQRSFQNLRHHLIEILATPLHLMCVFFLHPAHSCVSP